MQLCRYTIAKRVFLDVVANDEAIGEAGALDLEHPLLLTEVLLKRLQLRRPLA